LAGALQLKPHDPQLFDEVKLVSHPSAGLLLQSANPGEQLHGIELSHPLRILPSQL